MICDVSGDSEPPTNAITIRRFSHPPHYGIGLRPGIPAGGRLTSHCTDMRTIRRVQQKRQRAPEVSAAEKHQRAVTADGKTHVSRIMAKLGTRDRSRIVALAYEYRMGSACTLAD